MKKAIKVVVRTFLRGSLQDGVERPAAPASGRRRRAAPHGGSLTL